MTRKGLALGAVAALAVSGLVSSPASASESLTLAPSAGTGYTTLSGSTFTVTTGVPVTVPSTSYAYLKYRVTNAGLESVTVDLLRGSTGGTETSKKYGTATDATGGGSDASGVTDADFVVIPQASTNDAAIGSSHSAAIQVGHSTATSVGVTAWLDTNGNNTIDVGEFYSPTRTVTFVKASAQTATVSLVAPIVGASSLKARVAFSDANINVRQIDAGDVLVQFGTLSGDTFTAINSYADNADGTGATTNSTTVTATNVDKSNNSGNDVVWNSTDSVYEAFFSPTTVTVSSTVALSTAAATTYAARLFLDQDDNGTTAVSETQEGSTSSSKTAASATGYSVKWSVVGSANAITSQVGYEDAGSVTATGYTDDQAMAASVRATASASSAFTFEVFVGTDVTVPVAVKSVPVVVTVSDGTGVTLADGITVDGLTVFTGQSRAITKSTDTSGKVSFTIAAGKADDTDRLDFVISVNGTAPGANTNSADGSVTFAAADYEVYAAKDLSGNAGVSITSGASYAIDYVVVDQWGQAPADNLYRVVGIDKASSNAERTTAADFAVSSPVVGGKATLSIKDNGVGTGSYAVRAGWATVDGQISTSEADDYVDTTVRVVTDATPSKITLDALVYGTAQLNDANSDGDYSDDGDTDNRTKLVLETKTLYSYIANTATASETAPTLTANIQVTVAGTVTNAAGTAVPYAQVTIAAPNLLFVTNGNYVLDTVTLVADSSGEFSVDVYSRSGQLNTIRISSGAASATQALTYAGAVAGAAASFTVTAPASSAPGRTVDVAVRVLDKNGNGVQGATVTLSSTGPGYLINTSGTSLKDGTFNTKLLLGSNDTGTAVVKATMTIAGEETSKTVSIVIGSGAASGTGKVNVASFNGKLVVYAAGLNGKRISWKVGGNWGSAVASSNYAIFNRPTPRSGVTLNVEVFVDGMSTLTKSVVTR
jgi:hypothetical protein